MRPSALPIFAVVLFAVFASCHAFVWYRLVYQLELPQPYFTLSSLLLCFGALSGPVGLPLVRLLSPAYARIFGLIVYVWMGSFFLLFSLSVAVDLALLVGDGLARLFSGELVPRDYERRLSVLRAVRAISLALWGGAVLRSFAEVRAGAQLEEHDVTLDKLPRALDGLRIAQISDLHVAPLLGRTYVKRVVALVNAQKPDIIAITGDLVDGSVIALERHIEPLKELTAKWGVFFCTGNHEYYSGVDAWLAHLPKLGVRALRNEHVTLGDQGAALDIAGVDDVTAKHFGGDHGADLTRALEKRDASRPVVLLAHQPRAIFEAAEHDVDLMLSGHTHGGQLWPFGWLVRLQQPFVRGLHRLDKTQIYINRGTGFWGPPMRLGSLPEVSVLTLRSAVQ